MLKSEVGVAVRDESTVIAFPSLLFRQSTVLVQNCFSRLTTHSIGSSGGREPSVST
jgi:hypothetical protein